METIDLKASGFYVLGKYEIGKIYLMNFGLSDAMSVRLRPYLKIKAIDVCVNDGVEQTWFEVQDL